MTDRTGALVRPENRDGAGNQVWQYALKSCKLKIHQHECWGHEITKKHRIVQRLNQIHHNMAYGDIPEVECPTVIRLLKTNDGHALNWETVYFTDYHYDDKGTSAPESEGDS